MAERAGIFDSVDSIDYTSLTMDTFDWPKWIEQETRRRYVIFRDKSHSRGGTDVSKVGLPDPLSRYGTLYLSREVTFILTAQLPRRSALL